MPSQLVGGRRGGSRRENNNNQRVVAVVARKKGVFSSSHPVGAVAYAAASVGSAIHLRRLSS